MIQCTSRLLAAPVLGPRKSRLRGYGVFGEMTEAVALVPPHSAGGDGRLPPPSHPGGGREGSSDWPGGVSEEGVS